MDFLRFLRPSSLLFGTSDFVQVGIVAVPLTLVIIAGGIDVVYPSENTDLHESIAEAGLLLAEMPPGTQPTPRHFPIRNRIIGALALGTVVVEAAERSGSLITARETAERGGEVMAVPESPLDPRSQGCNHLIREGAKFADRFVDSLNTSIVELVDEFAARVFQELNYVQEGINAERFERLYGDRPDVVVPGIVWEYTSPKVITMDWIDGTKLSEQEELKRQGLDVLQLVDTGIQCSLRQLLEFGYFHADPHPGNLLATPEGKLAPNFRLRFDDGSDAATELRRVRHTMPPVAEPLRSPS